MQKMVRACAGGATYLMQGDPLCGSATAFDGAALPTLLEQGWRIVSVHMSASAGVASEQHAAFILLERD
mgnify:CR=1 FL=1